MIDVDVPAGSPAGALVRSFAGCLASVTEAPLGELPQPDTDLAKALGIWRSWLAEHDAGLVPIADPDRFQWAGWWIATLQRKQADTPDTAPAEVAVLAFGTPPGIVLSPLDPALLGRATADLSITAGYAVASLDPVLRLATPQLQQHGTVEALAIAPAAETDMQLLDVAHALEGAGSTGTATPHVMGPSAREPATAPATTSR